MKNNEHRRFPHESETVEWKQSLGEWKEIVETCAAFATSQGGAIYIGIGPKGEHIGVQVGQGTIEDLVNKIKINSDPPQFPSIKVSDEHQSAIIEVDVEQNPVKPVWAFGRPVKRVGRTNQILRRDEAQRLLETTTGRTWDAFVCDGFSDKGIDRKAVRDFLERSGMRLSTPVDELLKNTRFPNIASGYCNAAVLLFGKYPQRHFVEADIKCARFKGADSIDFLDEQTYEGPILRQLDNAMGFVSRNTRRAYKITGRPEREIIPEYPEDAVREAIINALCHRNYAAAGTIQVRIYNDCLEVWNPGGLPHGLTLRALYHRHASHPGNPLIAQALYRARLIEHWGTGTLRIIRACKARNIKVEFKNRANTFIVCLRQPSAPSVTRPDLERGSRAVSGPSRDQVGTKSGLSHDQVKILRLCRVETPMLGLLKAIGRKHRTKFRNQFIMPLLKADLIELTIPDKPNSRLQKYRLTKRGWAYLKTGGGKR